MAKIAIPQARNGAARQSPEKRGTNTAEIERLAYQFFVERGYEHGHDVEDWTRAEAVLRSRRS